LVADQFEENHPSGAKASIYLAASSARLKAAP